jgi:hypothetical protein
MKIKNFLKTGMMLFLTASSIQTIKAQFCNGLTTLTAAADTITDGSGSANYANNTACSWLIQPSGNPVNITLTMDSLNLTFFNDAVRVYDGTSNAGTLIANYRNNNLGFPAVANSGSMFVEFATDGFGNAQGWRASYTSGSTNCQPNTVLTANNGAFTDGTRNGSNYANNINCEWLIQPIIAGLFIDLTFTRFSLATGDSLILYDGIDANAPILATLVGNATTGPYLSTAGNLFVRFVSTSNGPTSNGWRITYNTRSIPTCAGLTTLTSPNGLFSDGSFPQLNYAENSNCQWLIQPPGAVFVDLQFNYFSTEANYDFVTVYQGANNNGILLGSFSGNNIPASLTSTTGSMFIEFNTDGSVNSTGWEGSYTSSNFANITAAVDTIYLNAGAGSTNSFQLSANSSWTTTDNQSWLISTPVNGTGNQTINLLALQGNIGPERTGQLYINPINGNGGDTVTVIQRSSGRFLGIPIDTLFFLATGSPFQTFNLQSNVSWSLSNSQSWISLNPMNGNNNSNPQVSVTDNPTNLIRSGFIVASGSQNAGNDTIYIIQDSLIQSFSVSPKNILFNYTTGSVDSVQVNANLSWVLTNLASWITPSATSGTDSSSVIITANTANLSTTDRTTYLYFDAGNGKFLDSVLITQEFLPRNFSVNPTGLTLASPLGSVDSMQVNANLSWVLTNSTPWITTSTTFGNDSTSITITANTSNLTNTDRTAYVYFNAGNGRFIDSVLITQEFLLRNFSVNPTSLTLASPSGNFDSIAVNANLPWTLINSASWLNTNVTSGNDSTTVIVSANSSSPTVNSRSATIYFDAGNGQFSDSVEVTQQGLAAFLTGSPDTVFIGIASGEVATFNIAASGSWTVNSPNNWLVLNTLIGNVNGVLTATATSTNSSKNPRVATLTISDTANNLIDTLVIVQAGTTGNIVINPSNITLPSSANGTGSFNVTSDINWSISGKPSWISLSTSSGINNGIVNVSSNSINQTGSNRVATLLISGLGAVSKAINITQVDANSTAFLLSVDTLFVGSTAGSTADFTVIAYNNWTLTESSPWLALNKSTGNNTDIITVLTVSENLFGTPRFTDVIATSPGNTNELLVVAQFGAPLDFNFTPDSLVIGADSASFGTFNISSNLISWNATTAANWLRVSPATGSLTGELTITATNPNTTDRQRSSFITISSAPFIPLQAKVTQDTVRSIGINERLFSDQVKIYPNPSIGEINIKFDKKIDTDNSSIEVRDLVGKLVSYEMRKVSSEHLVFNFSGLENGFYFIRINMMSESLTKKVLLLR